MNFVPPPRRETATIPPHNGTAARADLQAAGGGEISAISRADNTSREHVDVLHDRAAVRVVRESQTMEFIRDAATVAIKVGIARNYYRQVDLERKRERERGGE